MAANSQVKQWMPGAISTEYIWSLSVQASRSTIANIESFNGRLRDECLNVETVFDLSDAREKLTRWRLDYNQVRPHSALGDRSPEEFVREWQASSAAPPRTAWPANNTPAGAVQAAIPRIQNLYSFPAHPWSK